METTFFVAGNKIINLSQVTYFEKTSGKQVEPLSSNVGQPIHQVAVLAHFSQGEPVLIEDYEELVVQLEKLGAGPKLGHSEWGV